MDGSEVGLAFASDADSAYLVVVSWMDLLDDGDGPILGFQGFISHVDEVSGCQLSSGRSHLDLWAQELRYDAIHCRHKSLLNLETSSHLLRFEVFPVDGRSWGGARRGLPIRK